MYFKSLPGKDLEGEQMISSTIEQPCEVCKTPTEYIGIHSRKHICSRGCLFSYNKQIARTRMKPDELLVSYLEEAVSVAITRNIDERSSQTGLSVESLRYEDFYFKYSKISIKVSFDKNEHVTIEVTPIKSHIPPRVYTTEPRTLWEEMREAMVHYHDEKALRYADIYLQDHQDYEECIRCLYNIKD